MLHRSKLNYLFDKTAKTFIGGTMLVGAVSASVSYAAALPDFATLVENEGEAVVNIAVTSAIRPASLDSQPDLSQIPEQFRKFFEQQNPEQRRAPRRSGGVGSGFIISQDGYILTNAHVVDKAAGIVVKLRDRRELNAELIGSDSLTDVALLKVDANALPVVRTAENKDVKVGEWVLAIGSPFGFDQTATQGIVSAVSRNLPSADYVPFIQTDVAVNPGNSGGPLFNTNGEVVGINSQIYSSTGGYQGLSFAIPIDIAMNVAEQLKEYGKTNRGWLGVSIQDVNPELAESFGLDKVAGALISSVGEDSPASKAGLETGDVVLKFNGTDVNRSGELPSLVGSVRGGQTVAVEVFRNGQITELDVTVGLRGDDNVASLPLSENVLGMQLAGMTADELQEQGIDKGVTVVDVEEGSVAAKSGLAANDILLKVDGMAVSSVNQATQAIRSLPRNKPVPVLVQRNGNPMFLTLRVNSME